MQNKMSANEVLSQLIAILEWNLAEMISNKYKNEYTIGSWEASIECLEIIARWSKAKHHGLDYNPEVKFNIYK